MLARVFVLEAIGVKGINRHSVQDQGLKSWDLQRLRCGGWRRQVTLKTLVQLSFLSSNGFGTPRSNFHWASTSLQIINGKPAGYDFIDFLIAAYDWAISMNILRYGRKAWQWVIPNRKRHPVKHLAGVEAADVIPMFHSQKVQGLTEGWNKFRQTPWLKQTKWRENKPPALCGLWSDWLLRERFAERNLSLAPPDAWKIQRF